MAREKTWEFVWNSEYLSPASALDQHRYTLWFIAATLTGNFGGMSGSGLWSLYASSDSVAAGTDSTDRWQLAGPYDGTKIVRGGGGLAHSWIVLQSPVVNGQNWYLTLSLNTSSDVNAKIIWSKAAPASGSATVTPTATGTDWTAGGEQAFSPTSARGSRFCMSLADDGQFFFHGLKPGLVGTTHELWFIPTDNYQSSDLYPVVTYQVHYEGGLLNTSTNVWNYNGPTDVYSTAYNYTRYYDGTGGAYYNHCVQPYLGYVDTANGILNQSLYTKLVDWPVHFFVSPQTYYGSTVYSVGGYYYRGRAKDLYLLGNYRRSQNAYEAGTRYFTATTPPGLTTPLSGAVEYASIGHWLFPAPEAFNCDA